MIKARIFVKFEISRLKFTFLPKKKGYIVKIDILQLFVFSYEKS